MGRRGGRGVPLALILCLCWLPSCGGRGGGVLEKDQRVLDLLVSHWERAKPSGEAAEALAAFETRQASALDRLEHGRFIFLHMNPAAGLGNRLVALVSGFMLGIATDRAVLVDWEAYTDVRVHRSKEVSTMSPLSHFVQHGFPFDAAEVLPDTQAQQRFGWDFTSWGRMSDEDVKRMADLRGADLNALYPQRVLVVEAISYFGRLLADNPHYTKQLQALGQNPFPQAAAYILKPSPHVHDEVSRFYLDKFAGRRVIGVHLRTIEYMSPTEVVTALRCALFLSGGDASSVFVASDTEAGMLEARRHLGERFMSFASVAPGRASNNALRDGWVNVLLLSKADALVAKARSSFALLASGISGGPQGGRPFYETSGEQCVKLNCSMPMLQRDHPTAILVDESECIKGTIRVTVSQ